MNTAHRSARSAGRTSSRRDRAVATGPTDVLTGGLVLLPGVSSPPPSTLATLLTVVPPTFGTTGIVATRTFCAPAAIDLFVVHVTVCALTPQLKLAPAA